MEGPDTSAQQIVHGLLRAATLLRQEGNRGREGHGLSVTQAQALSLLETRGAMRVGSLAAHLGVTAASMSDSVTALARKGLVRREPDPADGRATLVRPTPGALSALAAVRRDGAPLVDAVAALDVPAREQLLAGLTALIHGLTHGGTLPPARMCTGCASFRRDAHPGTDRPHHCAYIDRPLGVLDLRIDCPDHTPIPDDRPAPPGVLAPLA